MRKLMNDLHGVIDLGVVLIIGIAFAALMVIAFIIFTLQTQLLPTAKGPTTTALYNQTYDSIHNVTAGFDDAVSLILVAITIFILAIAISALLLLRGR